MNQRCPQCGKMALSFDEMQSALRCANCGYAEHIMSIGGKP
ncbi:MAG: hypothetical protein V1735_06455 [Nanoarchaeota archaeon]